MPAAPSRPVERPSLRDALASGNAALVVWHGVDVDADGTPTPFAAAVHDVLAHIPRGVAVSYGWVADEAGFPGAARAVGAYLRSDDDAPNWWRVVSADGRLVAPRPEEQARRLGAEGVAVTDGRLRELPEHPGR